MFKRWLTAVDCKGAKNFLKNYTFNNTMKVEFSTANQEQELYVGLSTEELRGLLKGEQIKSERVEIEKKDLAYFIKCDFSGEYPDTHFSIGMGGKIIQKILTLPSVEELCISEYVSERLGPYRGFFYHLKALERLS